MKGSGWDGQGWGDGKLFWCTDLTGLRPRGYKTSQV